MSNQSENFNDLAASIFADAPTAKDLWNKSAKTRSIVAVLSVLRTDAGLTQKEVAERTGWDKAFVSRLESGAGGLPDTDTISRYAEACGMEVGLVFASLKSAGVGHIHSVVNISGDHRSNMFGHAIGQDFFFNIDK